MSDLQQHLTELGLVPVVKIQRAEDAVPLVRALRDGGLPAAEITFRTDAAEQAIKNIAAQEPDILLGAGTVLTLDQAERAVGGGAKFIVSPGFNPRICAWCIERGIPVTPGVNSPSQIEQALEMGLNLLKFFPAEASGGLAFLKAIAAPYREVRFMPTGGINQSNLAAYLAFPQVAACGGSWLAPEKLLAEGDFAAIGRITRQAMATALGLTLARIELPKGQNEMAPFCALFTELLSATGQGPEIAHTEASTAKLVFTSLNRARARAFLTRMGLGEALDGKTSGAGLAFSLEG